MRGVKIGRRLPRQGGQICTPKHNPDVASALRDRFPIVFIDEVQDNSELQSAFLHRLFVAGQSSSVIRQRFGDSNQAIYNRAGGTGAITDPFPGPNRIDLPNSARFGQKIADVTAGLGVRPHRAAVMVSASSLEPPAYCPRTIAPPRFGALTVGSAHQKCLPHNRTVPWQCPSAYERG
ncbi:UvrD-helicase domain-containing protein [Rhizobium leguminosarum]|nr:UvrD-helicase domain-containing protein [Rhizobium leguminosarum]